MKPLHELLGAIVVLLFALALFGLFMWGSKPECKPGFIPKYLSYNWVCVVDGEI